MHGWVSAGKPSSPPVFTMSQLQPIPAFRTPHPVVDFPGGCAWEKGPWSQSMSHTLLPPPAPEAATSTEPGNFPGMATAPSSPRGSSGWERPSSGKKEAPYFIAWTACGSGWEQKESKGGAVGCFPCQQWPCVLYSLCLARKVGFLFQFG